MRVCRRSWHPNRWLSEKRLMTSLGVQRPCSRDTQRQISHPGVTCTKRDFVLAMLIWIYLNDVCRCLQSCVIDTLRRARVDEKVLPEGLEGCGPVRGTLLATQLSGAWMVGVLPLASSLWILRFLDTRTVFIVSQVQYPLSLTCMRNFEVQNAEIREHTSARCKHAQLMNLWPHSTGALAAWHTCFVFFDLRSVAIRVAPSRCTECHHNWKEDWELFMRMSCVKKKGCVKKTGIMFGPEWFGCQCFQFQAVLA